MAVWSSKERRGSPRVPLLVRVECKTPEAYVIASCVNISETGMFVTAKQTFEVSEMVTLLFNLPPGPSGHPIRTGGIVVSAQKDDSMALRFVGLRPLFREAIVKYIAEA